MKNGWLVVVLWVALVAVAKAEVKNLDESNYETFHKENPLSIVKFYAPWCGHCKNMAPLWEQYAQEESGYPVAKVDCTVAQSVCQKEEVRGYPTVKAFSQGRSFVHEGARTIEAFRATVERAKGTQDSSSVVSLDESNYDQFHRENPLSIVKFYAPWCGHCKNLAPLWEQYAQAEDGYPVAKVDCTVSAAICQREEVRGYPTVKIFRGGASSVYKGQRTIAEFQRAVRSE